MAARVASDTSMLENGCRSASLLVITDAFVASAAASSRGVKRFFDSLRFSFALASFAV